MKLFRQTRGSGSSRRKLVGLAMAASLVLPVGVVAGLGLASSAPAGASVTPNIGSGLGAVYVPIQPCRLIDTVPGSGYTDNGQTLVPGNESITTPDLHHMCGGQIPSTSNLDAVVINLTAVNPSTSGFLTAFGAGQQPPVTSTVNFVAGQTIANQATIATTQKNACCTEGYGGEITIDNWQGSTDVIVDVQGYYTADWNYAGNGAPGLTSNGDSSNIAAPGLYYPLAPSRVADTRSNSGYQDQNETLGPQSQINFFDGDQPNLPGGIVPVNATAVVLNVTAINPTAASYLTVWGTGSTQPFTSNLNFPAGTTIANRVIVPVTQGQVSILNWAGTVNVAVDVDGYFADQVHEFVGFCDDAIVTSGSVSNCHGASYYPLVTPQRIADTRAGSTYEDSSQTIHAGEYDTVNVPADAFGPFLAFDPKVTNFAPKKFQAADINLTVVNGTAASYLTLYPSNTELAIPQASDINWVPGDIISNGDIVSTGTSDPSVSFQAFNYAGSTDAVIDLYGYFSSDGLG
jgi:hypothetical protein